MSHCGWHGVSKTNLEVLSDLTNESLERELADEELSGLLVPSNLTESDGTGAESVGLLDSSSGGLKETRRKHKLSPTLPTAMTTTMTNAPGRSSWQLWLQAACVGLCLEEK